MRPLLTLKKELTVGTNTYLKHPSNILNVVYMVVHV